MKHEINIRIRRGWKRHFDEGWLRRVVEAALAAQKVSSPVELGLVITDDATVRRLNRKHRGRDETTDVLAFALTETASSPAQGAAAFIMPPDRTLHLGEVVISYPQALRQSGEQGHPVERELALLITHGVLHLLGYDHADAAGERRMRAVEAEALRHVMGQQPES